MMGKRRSKDAVNRVKPQRDGECFTRGPDTSVKVQYKWTGNTPAIRLNDHHRQTIFSLKPSETNEASHSENLPTSTLMRDEIGPSPSPPNTRFAETFLETNDGFMAIV
jgi:hypothetical protein